MELFNSNLNAISSPINNSIENDSPLHTTVIQTYLDSTKRITCLCSIIPKHLKEHCHQCHHSQTPIRQLRGQFGLLHLWILWQPTSCAECPILLLQKIVAIGLGYKSLKLTWHLKIDGWNTSLYIFLLEWHRFKCYVSIGVANWTSAGHFQIPPRLGEAQICGNEIRNHSDIIPYTS